MAKYHRVTVEFEESLYEALCLRAAEAKQTTSHLVNSAVRQALLHDADDITVFADRAAEPRADFSLFVQELRRRKDA